MTKEWRRSVNDYARLVSFTFKDEEDFGVAISVFNLEGHALDGAPFDIVPVNTVLVPEEASRLWSDWLVGHDVEVSPKAVLESRDLPADTVAALRKHNYHPSL